MKLFIILGGFIADKLLIYLAVLKLKCVVAVLFIEAVSLLENHSVTVEGGWQTLRCLLWSCSNLTCRLAIFFIRLCQYSQEVYNTAKTCNLHYNGVVMPINTQLSLSAMKLSLKGGTWAEAGVQAHGASQFTTT